MTVANIVPTAEVDGVLYATAVPLTSTEATLGDALVTPSIIPTNFGQCILAVIQLSNNGIIVANNTYVVLQVDMGDGVWVDANWCVWTGTQGNATFVFSNGIAGANVFQQSRDVGQVPVAQSSGSNQITLGGRLRFVGKTLMSSGSSSAPGVPTSVTVTIRYRLMGLR